MKEESQAGRVSHECGKAIDAEHEACVETRRSEVQRLTWHGFLRWMARDCAVGSGQQENLLDRRRSATREDAARGEQCFLRALRYASCHRLRRGIRSLPLLQGESAMDVRMADTP